MASDGRVVIDVILDDGKVVKGVADVKGQIGGIGQASEKSALGVGKIVTALGLVAAARKGIDMVTSAIGGAISRVDTLSGFPVVMERMGFSSDQAKSSIDKLSEGISGLPTTLDGIVKSTQGIALMTGDLDVATDTALALNNAFLASGSSSYDAERGLDQYVKMLSKGKVEADSWSTLQETMGFALNKTAEAFGFTGKAAQRDLYDALQKGKITFEDFNLKLIELNDGVGGFADVAKAGSAGIATSFTNMKTAVVRGVANIIQAFQDVLAKTPLQSIENILGSIGKSFGNLLNSIAAGIPKAADAIINLYNTLEPLMPLIKSIIGAIAIMALSFAVFNSSVFIIGKVREAIAALNTALLFNPWILAATAAIAAVLLIIQYWEPLTQFFSNLWSNILDIFNNASTAIQAFATTLSTTFATAWSNVTNAFSGAISTLLTGFSSLKEKLSIVTDIINVEQAFNLLKTAAEAILSSLLMLIGPWGLLANILLKVFTHTTLLQDVFAMLKGEMTFDEVANNFSQSISGIMENISQLASSFGEALPGIINSFAMIIPQIITLAADIITNLANGITANLPLMVNTIVSLIEFITTTIGTLLPQLIEVGVSLLTTIINGIVTALPMIIEVVVQLIEMYINTMTTMLPLLIEIGLTIVETLLNGIVTALPLIVESALNIILMLVDALITALPQLIQVGLLVLNTLIEGIIGALPTIIEAALTVIMALVGALILLLPQIIDAGIQIITALVNGLVNALPAIIEAALTLIMALVNAFIQLLPQLIDAGIKIITALVQGLIQVLPQLIQAGITLIMALLKAIIGLLPQLLSAGVQLIVALVKGVLSVLGQLLSAGASLILGLLGKVLSFVGQLLAAGVTLIGNLISGILSLIGKVISAGAELITGLIDKILSFIGKILTAGKDLVGNLIDGVLSKVNDMINVGKDLVSGLINGITNMAGEAINAITGVVDGVVNKAKSLLGIHSPSRVFRQIGLWTGEGMVIGLDQSSPRVNKAMENICDGILDVSEKYQKEYTNLIDEYNKKNEDKNEKTLEKIYKIRSNAAKKKRALTKKELQDIALLEAEYKDNKMKSEIDFQKKYKSLVEKSEKEYLEVIKNFVADKKSLDELSLVEEAAIWEQSIELFAEGSKERILAQKEYKKAVDAVNKEILAINKDYQSQMQKINDDLIKAENDLNKAYDDAYNKRVSTLMGFAGTFDAFKVELNRTGQELLDNLQGQVDGFKKWQEEFAKLSERGIDADLLDELSGLGVKALPELVALNSMTDEQLTQYSDLYREKSQLARQQAEKELAGIKEDTDKQILALRETAAKQLNKLKAEWTYKIRELTTTTANELDSLQQIGVDAGQGLLNGLASMEGPLVSKAQQIANSIKSTIQEALDIHSPSRWMRDFVAGNMAKGFDVGVDKHKNLITKASERFGEMVKPDVVNKLRGVKANLGMLGTSLQSIANTNNTTTYDHSRKMYNTITTQSTGNDRADLERQLRKLEFEFG